MKKLLLLAALAAPIFAEQPPSAPPKTETVSLTPAQQGQRDKLDATQQNINAAQTMLNLQYDQLRKDACWLAGLKPDECGMWITSTTVQKIIKPEAAKETK